MPGRMVVLGDELRVLTSLSSRDDVISGADAAPGLPGSPRAAVVGLDLRDALSLHDAKRQLKEALRGVMQDVRRYPDLAHICVVYLIPEKVNENRVCTAAAGIASRLHAALERDRGEYVDVILLDATACGDGDVLAERIGERMRQKAGHHTDTALTWSDIQDRSIARATMDEHV